MEATAVIVPVVLCGGSGTRLWPLSREGYPKQFLNLLGNRSLLQETLLRLADIAGVEAPIMVTNQAHRFLVAEQCNSAGFGNATVLLEPVSRNTAPAVAAAALLAMEGGADPYMLVLPSDHCIADGAAFAEAVRSGLLPAEHGAIVTFGVTPTEPATGYGYIQASSSTSEFSLKVDRFVEKPTRNVASEYLRDGNYFWNSGIFFFRASTYIAELSRFAPMILEAVQQSVKSGHRDLDFFRLDQASFQRSPSDSIDYAVMEHTTMAEVVPLDAGWSDVGSWDAVWQTGDKCESGNVVKGDVITHEVSDCLIHATHRMVAVSGLDNVMVIETPDAVLVIHKDKTQGVKDLVDRLRESGRGEATEHRKVYRPWGTYDGVDAGKRYQVKRITVNPGARLSIQMHHHRAEHWIVVSGTAKIRKGNEEYLLGENQSTYIPLGEIHCLENPGKIPLELIEVQSGSYLGEDDIVRLSDMYGRP